MYGSSNYDEKFTQMLERRIAELEAMVVRLEKIETVARELTDGSHPCFVSNHEKCKHDRYGYEGCEQCYDEALLAALESSDETD